MGERVDRAASALLIKELCSRLSDAGFDLAQPFEVGYDVRGTAEVVDVISQLRFTVTANLLGLPSVALPVGKSQGLPLGCQILGARYREDLCLAAAEEIEQRLGVITPIDPVEKRQA